MAREYDDTEYQFNEGTDAEVIEGQEKPPVYEDVERKPGKVSWKNIIILIIMAIIAVLIVYKVFTLMFGGKEEESKEVGAVPAVIEPVQIKQEAIANEKIGEVKEEDTTEPEMDSIDVKEVVTQPESNSVKAQEQEEVKKGESITDEFRTSINQQISVVQEGNKKLVEELKSHKSVTSDRLVSLEQTVDSLKSSITELDKTLMNLSSQLNRVEAATKLRRIQQIKAQKAMEQEVRTQKHYFVEAVIPGRAWIRGMDGSAFTITIGDEIAGYGKVVSINSYSGTVKTSSGNEIYYGIN